MIAKFLFVACLTTLAVANIPPYIRICGRKNPDLGKCVWDSVNFLRDKLKEGIPELDIPRLQPYEVEKLTISNTDRLKASVKNMKIFGIGDFDTKFVDIDLKKQIMRSRTFFKNMIVDGDYSMNAKFFVPIVSSGPFHLEIDDLLVNGTYKWDLIKRNDTTYWVFTSVDVKLTTGDFRVSLEPPSSKDNTVVAAVTAVLKAVHKHIVEFVRENIDKLIADIILDRSNKLFSRFPYEELFPDRE